MSGDQPKFVPCKRKLLDRAHLDSLSKEELIEKIESLQSYNDQLKQVIAKLNGAGEKVKDGQNKSFDFTKCSYQHILLRVLYLGWEYQGFAVQDDTCQTIEHHLMGALIKCKLIPSREEAHYHRCGRTDKGVSAFGQVISLRVRRAEEDKPALDYCKMLNRLLPADIRALSWQAVSPDISARFNCKSRTYKYFFPKANLDLEAMDRGAQYLVGTHDFRNLCKMDVGNGVTNFVRTIKAASVSYLPESTFSDGDGRSAGYEMCYLSLTAEAFLWHQVRCIVAVLLLIGRALEPVTIISQLLDIQNNPRKPQYPMANDIGLNLFAAEFDSKEWIYDESEIKSVIETLQRDWTVNAIKACHLKSSISELEKVISEPVLKQDSVLLRQESKVYKPLFSRPLCGSLEERIEHFVKRKRIKKEEETS